MSRCFAAAMAMIVITCLLSGSDAAGDAPPPGVLLHVSFDEDEQLRTEPLDTFQTPDPQQFGKPEYAVGDPLPLVLRQVHSEPDGAFGGAASLRATPGGVGNTSLYVLDAPGNIQVRRGTMAFWVRPDAPLWSATYRGGRHPKLAMVNFLHMPYRPYSKFINLGVNSLLERIELQPFEDASWYPEEAWPEGEWQHITVTWDAALGKKLYYNGELVAREDAPEYSSPFLGNLNLGSQLGSGTQLGVVGLPLSFDELYVFDYVLTPQQIRHLMESNEPPAARNAPDAEDEAAGMAWLENKFNWQREGIPVVPDGGMLRLTRALPERVRSYTIDNSLATDGKRETFWPHGYKDRMGDDELTFYFPDGTSVNYVRITGGRIEDRLRGEEEAAYAHVYYRRKAGGPAGVLVVGDREAEVAGNHPVEAVTFDAPVAAQSARFLRKAGYISDIGFYRTSLETPDTLDRQQVFHLKEPAPAESGSSAERIRKLFPPEDAETFQAVHSTLEAAAVPVKAGRWIHFATECLNGLREFDAVDFRFALGDFDGTTTLTLQIWDPASLSRLLAEFDVRFEGVDGTQEVRIRLDGLDVLAGQNAQLWVSAVFDRDGELLTGADGSRLALGGEPAHGGALYLAVEEAMLRDNFLWISEPQPWRVSASAREGDWYRQISALAEIMDRAEHILAIDSDNHTAAAIMSWIVSRGASRWQPELVERYPDPYGDWQLKDVLDEEARGDAPDWAYYGRESLRRGRSIMDWWINERMDPETGQLGGGASDDTTLVPGFVNFALIDDPDGRIRHAIKLLADHVWTERLEDGISADIRAGVHVYEEGTNVTHLLPRLFYGDPEAIKRQLITSKHYDGHILRINPLGQRLAPSLTYSATELPQPGQPFYAPYDDGAARMWHPGRILVWYNHHPRTLSILQDWADTWLGFGVEEGVAPEVGTKARYFKDGSPVQGRSQPGDQLIDHLYWLYETTGDDRYRQAFASVWDYPRWQVGEDRDQLIQSLKSDILNTEKYLPINTSVGQSTDRIVIPGLNIARMYLGDAAQLNKRQGWHYHAVSWEQADDDISRFVVENREDGLKVLLYNFHADAREIILRPWRLQHGRYLIRGGIDLSGDENADEIDFEQEEVLFRYEPVTFTIPSRRVYVLDIEQLEFFPERIEERPDLAIGKDDVRWEDGDLTVRVHNLGSAFSPATSVRLQRGGHVVTEQRLPSIPGTTSFVVENHEVHFPDVADPAGMEVVIDPDGRVDEITTTNNRHRIGAAD